MSWRINITKRAHKPKKNTTPEHPIPPSNSKEEAWKPATKTYKKKRSAEVKTPHGIKPYLSGKNSISVSFSTITNEDKEGYCQAEKATAEIHQNQTNAAATDEGNKGGAEAEKHTSTEEMDVEDTTPATKPPLKETEKFIEALKEIEAFMEDDDLLGEELDDMENKKEESKKVQEIVPTPVKAKSYAEVVVKKAPIKTYKNNNIATTSSKSDSLKRKEKDDEGEDTASSMLKRTKAKGSHD